MLRRVVTALAHGRTLSVEGEVIELRAPSGAVELRLKITEDGVVLQLEAARISLKAEESIDLECKTFNVNASSDVHVESIEGSTHVRGKLVYIN